MMLEVAPERTFGDLAPAFAGCEGAFALQEFANRGGTFFHDARCELHGTGFQPLECRFCHHCRPGLGPQCHAALETEWHRPAGRTLVARWSRMFGLWAELKGLGLARIAGL